MLPTKPQNQTMKTSVPGYAKILAPPYEACPRCGDMSGDIIGRVWRVSDERGTHLECDSCGHDSSEK